MRRATLLMLFLAAALHAPGSGAVVVEDLYRAEVPVEGRGRSDLRSASRAGLRQVVVKVTGSEAALELSPVQAALDEAESYLQQFSYLEETATDGLAVRLQYDEATLRALLVEAGAPLWTNRRPPVILWLVADDGVSGRSFVDATGHGSLSAAIERAFERRGVPLRLPLHDLEDTAALAPGTAWRLEAAALVAASQRYGVEDILAGRVLRLSDGSWLGDWTYLHDGERRDLSVTAADPQAFAAAGAGLAADSIARRYAVASEAGPTSGGMQVAVLGVRGFDDYAAVMRWLSGLDLVESVNPMQVDGDRLLLRIDARAGLDRLAPVIELNERLQPAEAAEGEVAARVYRWRR